MPTRVRTETSNFHALWGASANAVGPLEDGTVDFSLEKTMTDSVTPGYFKMARRAERLPMNPMTSVRRELSSSGDVTVKWLNTVNKQLFCHFSGNLACMHAKVESPFPSMTTGFPSPPAWQPLLQKALGEARTEGWDILTFMAEFHKTAAMLRTAGASSSHRAKLIYDRVIRYRHRSRRDLMEVFAEMWMEYRFGWRTMMYDLAEANGALSSLHEKGVKVVRNTQSATNVNNSEFSRRSSQLYSNSRVVNGLCRQQLLYQDEKSIKVRAGVAIELGLDGSPFMANPAITAYELIPYSWLVDYFFNTGEAVKAWAPFARGRVLWSFVSKETKGTRVVDARPGTYDQFIVPTSVAPSFTVGSVTERSRIPQDPVFDLRFRVNLNKSKIADIAALFLLGHARRVKGLLHRR